MSCGIQENKQTKANDLANILNIHVTKSQPEPVVQIDMNIHVTKLQPEPAVQIENTHQNSPAESVHVYLSFRDRIYRECVRVSLSWVFLARKNRKRTEQECVRAGTSC